MEQEAKTSNTPKILGGLGVAIIVAGVIKLLSGTSAVTSITLDETPYTMNLNQQTDLPWTLGYLKRSVVTVGQWGPYAANVDTPPSPNQFITKWLMNGSAPVKCGAGGWNCTPGQVNFKPALVDLVAVNSNPERACDAYQSGVQIASMAGTTHDWVVVTGTPRECWASGTKHIAPQAFSYSLDQTNGLSSIAQMLDLTEVLIDQNNADPTIDGDTLYVRQRAPHHDLFSAWNMNTGANIASNLTVRPAWNPQTSIDGHTWHREVVQSFKTYKLVQDGGTAATPTSTPPAEATLTPTAAAPPPPTRTCPVCPICPPTPTRTKTPCIGCPLPTFTNTPNIGPAFTKTPTPGGGPSLLTPTRTRTP